jgi:hypothetical protein
MAQNERSDASKNKADAQAKAKAGVLSQDNQAGTARKPPAKQREASSRGDTRQELSGEELHRLIAEAAYYRAQQRGFSSGYEEKDWLEAEAQVMTRLGLRS